MKNTILGGGLLVTLVVAIWLAMENTKLRAKLKEQADSQVETVVRDVPAMAQTAFVNLPPKKNAAQLVNRPAPIFTDLWSDSQWRADRFNEAYLQAEARNARFFQHLKGWSVDRVENFKRLLADQSMRIGQLAANADGTQLEVLRVKNDSELKSVLSDEEYNLYVESARMETSRETVSNVLNVMRSRGVSVDSLREDALLQAYSAALHDIATQAPAVAVSQLSPREIAAYNQTQIESFNRALMRRAAVVLNESELKAFMAVHLDQGSR